MAKKPSNDQASHTAVAAAPPTVGTAIAIGDGGGTGLAGAAGNGTQDGGNLGEGTSNETAIAALISNAAPAASDASAGSTEVGGDPASSSGDVAASSEQLAFAAFTDADIPEYLDQDGKVRDLELEDVRPFMLAKNVKIDGVFLEHNTVRLMPKDIFDRLTELEALVKE